MGAFDQLDPRIQHWIWEAGWSELKDAQERAITSILKPGAQHDVIVAAATASGKTEAAFFPIPTHMLQREEDCCVAYVSPLKALINDQWSRLDRLCEALEIPVTPWHGDIGDTKKKRFLKRPRGCLLITPESLEGLLIRQGSSLGGLFAGLQFIVIDELHAFIDSPRGTQLQSLMDRIEVALKRRVWRVGLSATLGEMRLAADFLRPGASQTVDIIDSKGSGQELRVLVKGYYDRPPRLSDKEIEALEATGQQVQKEDVLPEALVAIGRHLFTSLRGSNNLVFPNSRSKVELFADLLRRACDQAGVPNEFWPHHGSLSKEIREETEAALKQGERPTTAIATTTLELGIDIGAVKSVAQIGPAPSVASLRQRLGRSGRRKGEPAILRAYEVAPAKGGKVPTFDGMKGKVHDVVRAEMRSILESDAVPAFLDGTAQALLGEARDAYGAANLGQEAVQQVGRSVHVFTWRGDWANDTLALMLVHRGLRAQNEGLTVAIEEAAAERVFDALYDIANEPEPDPLELVARVQNKWRRKWDWALPERLLSLSYALDELDVPNAVAAARDVMARANARHRP